MTAEIVAEYNHTLATAQLDALKTLHRLIKTEQDPSRLGRLTSILLRTKPLPANADEPPRTQEIRAQGRRAPVDRPAAQVHTPTPYPPTYLPAVADASRALWPPQPTDPPATPAASPLLTRHSPTPPPALALMQAAAGTSPITARISTA